MSLSGKLYYACRVCLKNPTIGKHPCCSSECRKLLPNCNETGCNNGTEPCIDNGINYWSQKCYIHGGRVTYDKDSQQSFQRQPYNMDYFLALKK
jgi:hypothetical protein